MKVTMTVNGRDDAKFLAGGHSLLPLMKLRFGVPAADLTRPEMAGPVRPGAWSGA